MQANFLAYLSIKNISKFAKNKYAKLKKRNKILHRFYENILTKTLEIFKRFLLNQLNLYMTLCHTDLAFSTSKFETRLELFFFKQNTFVFL